MDKFEEMTEQIFKKVRPINQKLAEAQQKDSELENMINGLDRKQVDAARDS